MPVWGVGVAGWNASAAGLDVLLPGGWWGLGMLLGPEETPVGVFLVDHPWLCWPNALVVGVVAVGCWGVVVC